jgi:hypothetical protein
VGLTSEVVWRIDSSTIGEETLSSKQPVTVKSWKLIVPSSYGQVETEINAGDVRIASVKFGNVGITTTFQ